MPDAPTIAALIDEIEQAHGRLDAALDGLSNDQLVDPAVDNGWSVKDTLAHITFWEQRLLAALQDAARGQAFDRSGDSAESVQQRVDRLNAAAYERDRERALADVLRERAESYRTVLRTIRVLPEAELAAGSRYDQVFDGSLLATIRGDTSEHYDEHAATIRRWRER